MAQTTPSETVVSTFPPILLCLPSDAELQGILLANVHFGKSLLFHQVMHFSDIGAKRFLLAVGAVPGSLLTLADELRDRGIALDIVRSPAEIISACDGAPDILVVRSEVWSDQDVVNSAIASGGNVVLTVEENPENSRFERIDLNSRWAGIAQVDVNVLKSITDLPDDWDLASTLLRQILQKAPKLHRIRQTDIAALKLSHLALIKTPAQLFIRGFAPNAVVESVIFKLLKNNIFSYAWHSPLARNIGLFAFPFAAMVSLIMAMMGQSLAAGFIAGVAVCAADLRKFILSAEHQRSRHDIWNIVGWSFLTIALATILSSAGESYFEASWLSLLSIGLLHVTIKIGPNPWFSPLLLTFSLLLGHAVGDVLSIMKIFILLQVAFLVSRNLGDAVHS